ncbi:hypothetical protein [Mycobacteroides abscessus]|uniref:hypothetical protein n=1 Tax=Mycobacteroides abscessus TaxID=36809 RepID=UPI0009A6C39C|nr:hypothetical protein [Mycobacteroides abscessus]SLH39335.1 Uncharacterised protein [Mycobacteroides abscessus subsp. massiliense]
MNVQNITDEELNWSYLKLANRNPHVVRRAARYGWPIYEMIEKVYRLYQADPAAIDTARRAIGDPDAPPTPTAELWRLVWNRLTYDGDIVRDIPGPPRLLTVIVRTLQLAVAALTVIGTAHLLFSWTAAASPVIAAASQVSAHLLQVLGIPEALMPWTPLAILLAPLLSEALDVGAAGDSRISKDVWMAIVIAVGTQLVKGSDTPGESGLKPLAVATAEHHVLAQWMKRQRDQQTRLSLDPRRGDESGLGQ